MMEQEWATIASTLGVVEDYYGFYEKEFLPVIWQTIEDMLTEAEPYRFTQLDLSDRAWTPDSTPVHLVNQAWQQLQTSPDNYPEWERRAISTFCQRPIM